MFLTLVARAEFTLTSVRFTPVTRADNSPCNDSAMLESTGIDKIHATHRLRLFNQAKSDASPLPRHNNAAKMTCKGYENGGC
jgi:hypothetical protein